MTSTPVPIRAVDLAAAAVADTRTSMLRPGGDGLYLRVDPAPEAVAALVEATEGLVRACRGQASSEHTFACALHARTLAGPTAPCDGPDDGGFCGGLGARWLVVVQAADAADGASAPTSP